MITLGASRVNFIVIRQVQRMELLEENWKEK